MADSPSAERRPAPVQRRGQVRRDAILDAAEALFIESGYEGATLKAISERTGIPLASVYHYFKDRGQVDGEVARRHAEDLTASVVSAVQEADRRSDLDRVLSLVVHAFVGYYRRHPGFVELWLARRNAVLSEVAEEFDMVQSDRLWRLLIDRDLIAADTPALVVRLAYEAGARLLDLAFGDDRHGDDAVIAEAVRLLSSYLGSYAPTT